ncbi:hypothetical protein AGDE_12490 [Angomonas deanei]|uniref:Transmembrane protein n=1 Tax=Angomonas deanei TaxID=59799 RepID=A0A7G2CDX4_9TRYP|nr:hypothetical protein AGDE_12490 [Angomonas deanei]CAD2217064.1 hypothetical protein, conserved [Angomonas deanei]|eukprot:EPY24117.1 hypothetical protein AGDE_12490 [Angomonas deanei]
MIVGFFLIAAVLAIAICCHFERSAQSKRRKEIKSMRERNHSDSEDDETSIEMETAPMQPSGRGSEGSSRGRRRA